MEKRSRRRTRDLVTQPAIQGLSQNEIGCARISMMARSTKAPFKGRIQKRKTNHLQIITFGLQRTAGPYKRANTGLMHRSRESNYSITSSALINMEFGIDKPSNVAVRALTISSRVVGSSM